MSSIAEEAKTKPDPTIIIIIHIVKNKKSLIIMDVRNKYSH